MPSNAYSTYRVKTRPRGKREKILLLQRRARRSCALRVTNSALSSDAGPVIDVGGRLCAPPNVRRRSLRLSSPSCDRLYGASRPPRERQIEIPPQNRCLLASWAYRRSSSTRLLDTESGASGELHDTSPRFAKGASSDWNRAPLRCNRASHKHHASLL